MHQNLNKFKNLNNNLLEARHNDIKKLAFIKIFNAKQNNLKNINVSFVKQGINLVTGVSGAGKTSLVIGTLCKFFNERHIKTSQNKYCKKIIGLDDIDEIHLINRNPLAKNTFSFVATYLGIFSEIRKIFASRHTAKILGIEANCFSLKSEEGRCTTCKGRGQLLLAMKFLEDTYITCHECQGKRFKSHILEVRYKNLNIHEVLSLTVESAYDIFCNNNKIAKILQFTSKAGLNYLTLGQSLYSLSGGEAQRIKLISYLSLLKYSKKNIIVFDEPTRGLHEIDIVKFVDIIKSLSTKE